jgi:Ca2+-binding EF-hand superfamily protein
MSSNILAVALVLAVGAGQAVTAQGKGNMRFQGMDRNNDGRITRDEWNGNDQSFREHDWNGDGVLSGDEVRPGGRRDRPGRDDEPDRSKQDEFQALDVNRDHVISRREWQGTRADFNALDTDRDGLLTRDEFFPRPTAPSFPRPAPSSPDLFTNADVNRNGVLSRNEWQWSAGSFDRVDRNRDGVVSREEFGNGIAGPSAGKAYQAGYDRGLAEGRAAGREDRERNQGWDLDGQRELEQADSGYTDAIGPRPDYQAGYRAAFRIGYREGFGPR